MPLDFGPFLLSMQLAGATTAVLLVAATPLAWWLAHSPSRWAKGIEAVVALPLVLPPTVLGFYLLILMGPEGWVGGPWLRLTGHSLTFSFTGLVMASTLYSLPFAVQPLQGAFESLDKQILEAAAIDGAPVSRIFRNIVLPLSSRGFLMAGILTFAHTVGEFGVVLMMGGNIPGQTRVVSIDIYEHVETMDYAAAHRMSAMLLAFSFCVLIVVYGWNSGWRRIRFR